MAFYMSLAIMEESKFGALRQLLEAAPLDRLRDECQKHLGKLESNKIVYRSAY